MTTLFVGIGNVRLTLVAALALALPVAGEENTKPAYCVDESRDSAGTNVVWRGSGALTYRRLAECAAPILWPSPDETMAPLGPEPYEAPRPGCKPGDLQFPPLTVPHQSTVYWRFDSPKEGRDPDNSVTLADGGYFRLSYVFYYSQDVGHCGDKETVEFGLRSYQRHGIWEVQLQGVIGLAHGNHFLNNRLAIGQSNAPASLRSGAPHRDPKHAPGLRLPLTILIEENKHASVPDRNGDGLYTPGYDVNRSIHDAWGLRDNFNNGVVSAGFEASMAKASRTRYDEGRIFPSDAQRNCNELGRWLRGSDAWPGSLGCYGILPCSCDAPVVKWSRTYTLTHVREIKDSSGDYNPREKPSDWWTVAALYPSLVSFRYDGERKGFAVAYPLFTDGGVKFLRVPLFRWAAGARFLVLNNPIDSKHHSTVDILVTPSLGGRLADWYVAAGRFHRDTPSREFRLLPYEYEVGTRIRWKPTGNKLLNALPWLGLRIGVRTDSWSIRRARVVFEAGGGIM